MAPLSRQWRADTMPHILITLFTLFLFVAPGVTAAQEKVISDESRGAERGWALGEAVTVECLNRTTETGEHIMDDKGELQYIPFWKCNETGRALELSFGSEKDINCTIAEVDDPLFHILEFYVHNDAPLSCRVPSLPPATHGSKLAPTDYTHLQFALTGALQLSHLHINPQLNILLHTTPPSSSSPSRQNSKTKDQAEADSKQKKKGSWKGQKGKGGGDATLPAFEGEILAAAAYSLPPTSSSPKLVIGDPLPLRLSVRWYSTAVLPPSTSRLGSAGLGGHVHLSTAAYCLLSFGAGLAVSLAYFRGVEMPHRLRRYGAEKLTGGGEGRGGHGYAYVPGGFPTYAANGKRD